MESLISIALIALTAMIAAAAMALLNRIFSPADAAANETRRLKRQIGKTLIIVLAVIAIIIQLPVGDGVRGQLLGLFGLAISAVIAMSSTTFVSNAMAGVMLRAVGNFKAGDFIRVESHFGRVTERDLFHTEIQTPDRDLITLPNLFLVNRPVQVVHESGTMISAEVSIGYDVHHKAVMRCLVEATERAELQEGYVRIMELLDHVVVYRAAGFLPESKRILLSRSRLREAILDCLHEAGIEIASPSLMSVRSGQASMPEPVRASHVDTDADAAPDELIFNKAENAVELEALKARREEIICELAELKGDADLAPEVRDAQTAHLLVEQERIDAQIEAQLAAKLAKS